MHTHHRRAAFRLGGALSVVDGRCCVAAACRPKVWLAVVRGGSQVPKASALSAARCCASGSPARGSWSVSQANSEGLVAASEPQLRPNACVLPFIRIRRRAWHGFASRL